MVENDLEFPASHETDFIIPTKAVQELQRLLGENGDAIARLSDNQIVFEVGSSVIVSKLIEGNYPNYRQVIPGEAKETLKLGREALLETARTVSLLSSEKSNSVKLVVGEAKESMSVNYGGKEIAIAFNPEFLMAPLRNLEDEEVQLDLIDEMSPGVLRGSGSFLYVLMPMRVTG